MDMISNNNIASDANIEQSKIMGLVNIQTNITKVINDIIPSLKNEISELKIKLQEANNTIEELRNTKQDSSLLGRLATRNSVSLYELGLDKVDNTSDLDKPISNATAVALNLKADKRNFGKLAFKDELTKSDLELGNVDNTSDLDKPISNAMSNALRNKVNYSDIKKIESLFEEFSFQPNEWIDISNSTNLKNTIIRILLKLGATDSKIRR